MFGLLQAQHSQEPQVHVQSAERSERQVSHRQDPSQSVSSVSAAEVLRNEHEQRW